MGAEGEERPREVACYRAGDETGRLDLKEKKESAELKNHLPVSLASLFLWLAGSQGGPAGVGD